MVIAGTHYLCAIVAHCSSSVLKRGLSLFLLGPLDTPLGSHRLSRSLIERCDGVCEEVCVPLALCRSFVIIAVCHNMLLYAFILSHIMAMRRNILVDSLYYS